MDSDHTGPVGPFTTVQGVPNPAQVMGRDLSPESQLAMLRQLTKRTGVVHEAQVMHLRLWPFSVDPELTRAVAKVDLDKRVVNYEWEDPDKREGWRPDRQYLTRVDRLLESVRFLLGEGWELTIKMNGSTTIFASRTTSARKGKQSASKRGKRRAGTRSKKRNRR
jgi:hypothetical protein